MGACRPVTLMIQIRANAEAAVPFCLMGFDEDHQESLNTAGAYVWLLTHEKRMSALYTSVQHRDEFGVCNVTALEVEVRSKTDVDHQVKAG